MDKERSFIRRSWTIVRRNTKTTQLYWNIFFLILNKTNDDDDDSDCDCDKFRILHFSLQARIVVTKSTSLRFRLRVTTLISSVAQNLADKPHQMMHDLTGYGKELDGGTTRNGEATKVQSIIIQQPLKIGRRRANNPFHSPDQQKADKRSEAKQWPHMKDSRRRIL